MKNKNTNPLLHALLPTIAVIAYVLIGYFFKRGWVVGLMVFLLIPIIESAVSAYKAKDLSVFSYPVFVTFIFLTVGLIFHIWHPTWVVFVTIPAFYAIAESLKRSGEQKADEAPSTQSAYSQYGNPYTPAKKRSIVPIIVSIIISIAAVCIVGIISVFGFLKGNFGFDFNFNFDKNKKAGYTEISELTQLDPKQINKIDVEWIDGRVDISFYDGDKIIVKETGGNSQYPMCYKIENHELKISEYISTASSSKLSKNLILQIPKGYAPHELDIEVVSANVYATELNVTYFDFETVSGSGEFEFAVAPGKIDIETVSGSTKIILPEDTTGYSVTRNNLSGTFSAPDFGNATSYGDGSVIIEIDSVSGGLTVSKAAAKAEA